MTVEPIRRIEDIEKIKKLLNGNIRDKLLFVLGINSGLRIGDLLKLRAKDFINLRVGDTHQITEQKTGKANVLMINKSVFKVFNEYREKFNPNPEDFLFFSRKGDEPLRVETVNRMVKSWCETIGLSGNYGCHSLRKTFGYIQRTIFGTSSELICRRYNHSSPSITMRYLGITSKEVEGVLLRDI
jgi:integrase